MTTEVQKTTATIRALKELMAQRVELGLRPVTDLPAFFTALSESGFELVALKALAAGGFFHCCVQTGAYSFHA